MSKFIKISSMLSMSRKMWLTLPKSEGFLATLYCNKLLSCSSDVGFIKWSEEKVSKYNNLVNINKTIMHICIIYAKS